MPLTDNDLAILTARFGAARFGASRFGFIPCPEDVTGPGTAEPGEYIYRETKPPITSWTLVNEDCVCRNICTLALSTLTPDASPILEDVEVEVTTTLSGVIGDVDGIVRVNWGDGGHDQQNHSPMIDGVLTLTHTYNHTGNYTITVLVHDERGCEVSESKAVSVSDLVADFTYFAPTEQPVQFTDTSTGTITGWSWDFDGEGTSTDQNPTFQFLATGTHSVTLEITGPWGTDSVTLPVEQN